ncbi:YaaA family protein [Leptotrichia sp. oral taxon 221]|uniref:YaaA family protein n=1 Tax=Leptotrichia sp. oral taxon 221 TaxID=712362 RepID=UPI001B8B73A0|nr:YaaA family protein [Leptotrichia sp. oral taxon 221]QUB96345.1 YaaA family protein [Leptotrichia sp. oral taxon 221]
MKIIISPSKTKKINKLPVELKNISIEENDFYPEILYPRITNEIIERIKMFSVEEIEKKFKLKKDKAEKLLEFYQNYENEKSGNALASYTGVAYKSIGIDTFDIEDFEYLESHLVILSALYGILTPYTNIKEYRLDMTNSIFENKSLYEVWKGSVNEYFEKEDVILNLASKEYSKLIKSDNLIDFEFWNDTNGKLKQISTNSKKMRGFTLNYIVKNRITNINNLKDITLNEYVFNKDMSSKKKFVYVKK